MRIRTENDIKAFNAALDQCTYPVWLMGPNEETYNLKSDDQYAEGMSRLMKGDDQLGIFTTSREDEAIMLAFCNKIAA